MQKPESEPESEPEEVASDGGATRAAGAGGAVVEAAEVQEQKQFLEKKFLVSILITYLNIFFTYFKHTSYYPLR